MNNAIKIVAIDDKLDNLTALSAVVRDALPEATLLSASNGVKGIELAAAEDPDVILLDILMPGMDGFEICRRLKADDRLRDIPVVFLTTLHTDAASRAQALQVGGEGFLAQPLEIAELTAQIRAMAKIKAANRLRQTEKECLEALVTERTQELQDNEARYRALFENMSSGVVIYKAVNDGEDFRIVNFNRAAENIENISRSEVIGRLVTEAFPGVKEFGLFQVFQRVWETGKPERYPISFYRDERMEGWRENYITRLDTGEVIAVYDDVTEKKRLESELQDLARFPGENPQPVMRFSSNGTLITANKSSDAILSTWTAPHGLNIPDEIQHTVQQAFQESRIIQFEIATTDKTFICNIVPIQERGYANLYGYDITKRKQAEQALLANQQYLQAVLDATGDALFVDDADTGEVLDVNESMCRMYGYTRAEALQTPISQLSYGEPPYSDAEILNWLQKARTEGPQTFEWLAKRKDGSLFWAEVKINPTSIGGKNRFVVSVRDISERKRAEEIQHESQEQYQALFENNHAAMFVIDPDNGAIVDVNPAAVQSYGWSREEFTSMNVNQINTLAPEEITREIQRARSQQRNFFQFKHRWRNGTIRDVEVYSGPVQRQGKTLLYSIVHDVTERRQMEQERQQLYDVLNASLNEIYLFDAETLRFSFVSKGAQRNLGYSSEELEQMTPVDIKPEFTLETFQEMVAPLRRGEIPALHFETIHQRKDATTYPAEVNLQLFERPEGSVFLAIIMDISERKRAEKALQVSEEEFRSLITNMAEGVALHELEFDETNTAVNYRLVDCNPRYEEISGLQKEEVVGRLATDIYQQDAAPYLEIYTSVAASKHATRFETYYPPLDVYLDISVAPWGEQGFATIFSDITERKRAEEALRLSEERWRLLVEVAPDAIFVQTHQNFAYLNPAAVELFGAATPSDLIGEPVVKHFHQDDRQAIAERIRTLNVKHQPVPNREEKILRMDGTPVEVEVSAVPFTFQGSDGALVFLRNISERKKVEASLRQIQWLLEPRSPEEENFEPVYGDVTSLNTERVILDAVGADALRDIMYDYLSLLGTSSAVYEKNGDYAMGIFSSGWCRLMDEAAFRLCQTTNLPEALASGKWLCHESCWKQSALPAITSNTPTDIECEGGIHLYAVPIRIGAEIIGSINVAYGDPPRDPQKQAELAQKYQIPLETLQEAARQYETRPQFLIDLAKSRLEGAARLIALIVERKRYEEAITRLNAELEQRIRERTLDLNSALEFLQQIMATTTTGISAYDETGQCILANDTMADIIGATKEQVLQQNYRQIHSWKVTGLYDLALAALETSVTQQKDVHIRTTFGKETWLDCRFTSFGTPEKRHLLLTVVDISERMQREAEIKNMNDLLQTQAASLEASNKELESFSYSVSHDLRAPLRAVDGYTNILVEDYGSQLSPEAMEVCNVIRNNTRRMSQLIDDMLNLSRAGRMELRSTRVDMKAVVQSVFTELTTAEERQRIEFHLAELPPAQCDPVMIHQVWSNLISNAIKFTSRCETAKIQVGYTSENQKIVYYIRDNGAGFDMRYVHKLFGIFQRLHGIKEYPGTGVGLAIVQRMINRHNGQVWAEGSVGNGATFYFTLPVGKE